MSTDQRVPVKLIHVDEHGTATVEEQSGRRSQWAAEKLLPPECYLCTGTEGAFQILAYGSAGRLRCVHAGPCPKPRARRSWLDACTRNANPAPAYVCVHCGVHVDPHHHTQTECAAERDKE